MTPADIIEVDRAELARRIAARQSLPIPAPIPTTPWISMSILQKAIRRRLPELALQAAATLLLDSPDRLWRRLGLIAFEDIGAADPVTFSLVTAAIGGIRVRAKLGGEWAVASTLVEMMVNAPKCRAADDLLTVLQFHPDLAAKRQELSKLALPQLRLVVLSDAPLAERALALWFIIGTDRFPSDQLVIRHGEPAFAFDLLDELGAPMTIVEVAREGARRLRSPLCPFVALLLSDGPSSEAGAEDDLMTLAPLVAGVPAWSLDWFTREGRRAFAGFLVGPTSTAQWVRNYVSAAERMQYVGNLAFFAEGSLLRSRLSWSCGKELRETAEVACLGAGAKDIIALLRSELSHLHHERSRTTR